MKTIRKLSAGQPGSKKWIRKYGERLVCVRYKYDSFTNKKMITVELSEEYTDWEKNENRIPDNKIMDLKIDYTEKDLRIKIKSLGGTWNQRKKVWELPYRYVKSLKLTSRVVLGDKKN
jgi:putative IMPACT (imprinted ancient) family translation regulator